MTKGEWLQCHCGARYLSGKPCPECEARLMATERKRRQREREKQGLARLEIWAKPAHHEAIKRFAAQMEDDENDQHQAD